jgi:hypothetical protein
VYNKKKKKGRNRKIKDYIMKTTVQKNFLVYNEVVVIFQIIFLIFSVSYLFYYRLRINLKNCVFG